MTKSNNKQGSAAQKHYELVEEYKTVLDLVSAAASGAEQAGLPLIKYSGKIVGLVIDANRIITPLLVNKADEVAGALGGIVTGGAAVNVTVALADGLPNTVLKVGVKVVGGAVSAYFAGRAGETGFSSRDALPSVETWSELFVFPEKINGKWYVEINKGGAQSHFGIRYMKEITDEKLVAELDLVERAHALRQQLGAEGIDPSIIEEGGEPLLPIPDSSQSDTAEAAEPEREVIIPSDEAYPLKQLCHRPRQAGCPSG